MEATESMRLRTRKQSDLALRISMQNGSSPGHPLSRGKGTFKFPDDIAIHVLHKARRVRKQARQATHKEETHGKSFDVSQC